MYRYIVIEELFVSDDYGEYKSYGFECYLDGEIVTKVSDVSLDKHKVNNFCNQLSLCNICADDLSEYIEDFLA